MNIVTIFNGKRSWASDTGSEMYFRLSSAFTMYLYPAEPKVTLLQDSYLAERWL